MLRLHSSNQFQFLCFLQPIYLLLFFLHSDHWLCLLGKAVHSMNSTNNNNRYHQSILHSL